MKVLALVLVAAVMLQVVVSTEVEVDADKPKKKSKNDKKAKKWFKPKMVRRGHNHGVITVPRGDPRAYGAAPEVWIGDAVLPLALQPDADLYVDSGAHFDVEHDDHIDHVDVLQVTLPSDALPSVDAATALAGPSSAPVALPPTEFATDAGALPRSQAPIATPAMGTNAAARDAVVPAARPVLKATPGAGCTAIRGVCGKVASCTGTVTRGLCPGDSTVACCVPRATTTPTTPTPTPTTPTPSTPVTSGLPMCSNNGAASGSYDGSSPALNYKNAATTWSLVPSVAYNSESGNPYRVPRDAYGDIASTDARLVQVASSNGVQRLHKVCAARFNALAAAARAVNPNWILKVASGWRVHPYRNDYNYYCAQMKIAYPGRTCREAGQVKAFKSPHETGLAFDLGSPAPFAPRLADKPRMLASPAFAWLRDNAHRFGVTPYKYEPWHWECVIPREAWAKGCEFTNNFNTRIRETRTRDGAAVNDISRWSA